MPVSKVGSQSVGSDEAMTSQEARTALLIMIDDLIKQATTENSHYYTAKVLQLARDRIDLDGRVFNSLAKLTKSFGE
jgi:hypothetical protein